MPSGDLARCQYSIDAYEGRWSQRLIGKLRTVSLKAILPIGKDEIVRKGPILFMARLSRGETGLIAFSNLI
jgi:hypothetical protein